MAKALRKDLPLVWFHGEIKTPPFSLSARLEAGGLLRRLQRGENLAMPLVRTMPSIAARCHELRIPDERVSWRIVYRLDRTAVVILAVFQKTTRQTPQVIIDACRRRLKAYEKLIGEV